MEQEDQQPQPPALNEQEEEKPRVAMGQPIPMPQYQPRVTASPMMSPVESIVTCFKKCFVFKGRARRSEFWWFSLLLFIVYSALTWLGRFVPEVGEIGVICAFLLSIPQFAAATRRLHDTGNSGWWIFVVFILFLGNNIVSLITIFTQVSSEEIARAVFHDYANYVMFLIICSILVITPLVYAIMDSDRKENKYGPSPKYQN